MGRLEGKVALVTEASRGIGRSTARLFDSEEASFVSGQILHVAGGPKA